MNSDADVDSDMSRQVQIQSDYVICKFSNAGESWINSDDLDSSQSFNNADNPNKRVISMNQINQILQIFQIIQKFK